MPGADPRTTIKAKMAERRFINELGNRIMLAVHQLPHTGDVQITIVGPHSDSENLLTHDEAVMLRDALQEALS